MGGRTRRVRSYALGRLRLRGQWQAWGHRLVPASRRRRRSEPVGSNASVQALRVSLSRESPSEWCNHQPFTSQLVYLARPRGIVSPRVPVCKSTEDLVYAVRRNARARETLERSAALTRSAAAARRDISGERSPRDDHRLEDHR